MKHMFDPGENAHEAIRRAAAAAAVEQATGPARETMHQAVQQLAATAASAKSVAMPAGYVDAVNAIAAGMRSALPEYERAAATASAALAGMRSVQPGLERAAATASAALAGMRSAQPGWERAAETVHAALANLAAQIDVSAPGLAGAGSQVQLTVRPAHVGVTASRPLLSVPAASELDTMDAADLRDLLHRLWSAFYAAASNPVVQFVVGTVINLVVLGYAIAAYDTAVAAYEQDRENNAVEQQRDATAPPIIVQPAPVTVIPEQRDVGR